MWCYHDGSVKLSHFLDENIRREKLKKKEKKKRRDKKGGQADFSAGVVYCGVGADPPWKLKSLLFVFLQ